MPDQRNAIDLESFAWDAFSRPRPKRRSKEKGENSSFHQMNKAIEAGMNLFEKEGWDAPNRKSHVCSQLTLVKTSGYVYLRTRLPGCEWYEYFLLPNCGNVLTSRQQNQTKSENRLPFQTMSCHLWKFNILSRFWWSKIKWTPIWFISGQSFHDFTAGDISSI